MSEKSRMDHLLEMEKNLKKDTDLDLRDYILNPSVDPLSWQFYKFQEANDWSAEEFGDKFVNDQKDYQKAKESVQNLMDSFVIFFLFGDGLIADELVTQLNTALAEKNWPEFFYITYKLKIENTHAETYSQAFHTIIPSEKHFALIKKTNTLECIRKKGEWMKSVSLITNKALKKICEAVCEGIFFTTQFSQIFFLRKIGMFNNFIESNGQINGDETLHWEEACAKAHGLLNREDEFEIETARKLIMEGVEIEKKFTDHLIQYSIISPQGDKDAGLSTENLYKYIEKLANDTCIMSGLEPVFPGQSFVLPWMEDINVSQKDNFYERATLTNYRRFNPSDTLVRWKELMDSNIVAVSEEQDSFEDILGADF